MSSNPSQPKEYERSGELAATEMERDLWREAFLRLYGALARQYSAKGRDERVNVEKYARTVEGVDPEDRPGYLATVGEVMIEALAEKSPTFVAEGPDPLRYDTKTLNERRAEALAAHLRTTGKSSIKSTEARAVLETIEGRGLDRKAVWRSLRALQGILRASKDIIGGVARLVVPSSSGPRRSPPQEGGSPPFETTGYGSISPRPRRWAVPWDGED